MSIRYRLLLTMIALWPAFSIAARKRSRTNAVSSATTTVFVLTEVLAIVSNIGLGIGLPQALARVADLRRFSLYSRSPRAAGF